MGWLITASVIWGFSFGLIKGQTTGIDPFVLGVIRSGIAAGFFLPWYLRDRFKSRRLSREDIRNAWRAGICGFIQIGLMYGPYLLSFRYLKAHEVALFTMTTPIIMALLLTLSLKSISKQLIMAALLATLGGAITAWNELSSADTQTGIVLVQLSNVLFAAGLLLWKRWFSDAPVRSASIMFPYFVGATLAAALLALLFAHEIRTYSGQQWLVMIWLGVVASGLGFLIWNLGALRVSGATLTVANNLKLPIAIIISLAIFGESANLGLLASGLAILLLALRMA